MALNRCNTIKLGHANCWVYMPFSSIGSKPFQFPVVNTSKKPTSNPNLLFDSMQSFRACNQKSTPKNTRNFFSGCHRPACLTRATDTRDRFIKTSGHCNYIFVILRGFKLLENYTAHLFGLSFSKFCQ